MPAFKFSPLRPEALPDETSPDNFHAPNVSDFAVMVAAVDLANERIRWDGVTQSLKLAVANEPTVRGLWGATRRDNTRVMMRLRSAVDRPAEADHLYLVEVDERDRVTDFTVHLQGLAMLSGESELVSRFSSPVIRCLPISGWHLSRRLWLGCRERSAT